MFLWPYLLHGIAIIAIENKEKVNFTDEIL